MKKEGRKKESLACLVNFWKTFTINMIFNLWKFSTQKFIFLEENMLFIILAETCLQQMYSKCHVVFQTIDFWFEMLLKIVVGKLILIDHVYLNICSQNLPNMPHG